MLRVWCGAALVLTALFATANMALSREWEAGEMDDEWQVVFTADVVGVGLVGSIMNLDGSDIELLIFDGEQIINPICSPRGDYLTFESEGAYYTVSINESESVPVSYDANYFARYGIWHRLSPNGDKILFPSATGELYVVNPDGSKPSRLTTQAFHPAWSPDGNMIAYVSEQEVSAGIYLMDVDYRISAQLTRLPTPLNSNYVPSWTPDGQKIMFIYAPDRNILHGYIYIMNSDGSDQRSLTDPRSVVATACFLQSRPSALIAGS